MSSEKFITLGTPTSTGGKVISAGSNMVIGGQKVVLVGDTATCNCGKKSCSGQGVIVCGTPRKASIDGVLFARKGDEVLAGCGTCFLLESPHNVHLGTDTASTLQIGGNGAGVSWGNGVKVNAAPSVSSGQVSNFSSATSSMSQSASSVSSSSLSNATAVPSASVPEINPNNMYWPPYNFLAKEGEKEIHVRYTQDVIETTVLAPEEWTEFFDYLDKTQNIGGAMTGTYDAFDTAKKLGGLGVTAYVKTHNGVDYIILKGYKQHMKTLLAGTRFRASNPQVVKLGLGALDSAKGMARYVKITAPIEVLVGSAINVLQYVLNDKYTLEQLGIDEAKLFVNALTVAGTALIIGAALPAVAATAVGSGLILVVSSVTVWGVDKLTDFEGKAIKKILELSE